MTALLWLRYADFSRFGSPLIKGIAGFPKYGISSIDAFVSFYRLCFTLTYDSLIKTFIW